MQSAKPLHKISMLAGTFITALVLSTGAIAQHGGGGGGHAAGGGGGGGHAVGGGYRGGYGGYHGGYGGYRGGYGGWRGGYGGWRGGYGWGGWGWGWGLGLGLYFATLPLYYQTYWWDGVPYYYADNTYYIYDPSVKQYQTVAPPAGLQGPTGSGPVQAGGSSELMVYPKNGQNADQQGRDRFECHQWAVSQTGYDPTTGSAAPAARSNDYMRAQVACLEGRGYSVQ